ncbi:helix-turn-helix transcriptional regulator [Actinophytocola xinjiangensis]|uniref:helix-turn-helix transcriptional regulator n=1 Tax=Actinophytocola xinjiangensis TaxID=485602 RepID=UPI001FE8953E|nr:LuxR C-terminal-related transcriptional regulator [Actinophytocola xinjiangensis]
MSEQTGQVNTVVRATDPLLRAGAQAFLRSRPGIRLLPATDTGRADVLVLVEPRVTQAHLGALDADGQARHSVLVTDDLPTSGLLRAVHRGVVAVLGLTGCTGVDLVRAVLSAGDGTANFPARLQGELVAQLARVREQVLPAHGLTVFGLTQRETDVLALIAEGFDTTEIAAKLSYSVRTVKAVLSSLMARHGLRHRAHAVAFAVRAGAC